MMDESDSRQLACTASGSRIGRSSPFIESLASLGAKYQKPHQPVYQNLALLTEPKLRTESLSPESSPWLYRLLAQSLCVPSYAEFGQTQSHRASLWSLTIEFSTKIAVLHDSHQDSRSPAKHDNPGCSLERRKESPALIENNIAVA